MPLTYDDVLQPKGELEAQLFPALSTSQLQARLTEYLAQGAQRAADLSVPGADVDVATKAWTYYRAFFAVYQRLVATPAEARVDGQGSRKYESEQAEAFLALANKWREEFEALVPPELDTTGPPQPESATFPNRFVW